MLLKIKGPQKQLPEQSSKSSSSGGSKLLLSIKLPILKLQESLVMCPFYRLNSRHAAVTATKEIYYLVEELLNKTSIKLANKWDTVENAY